LPELGILYPPLYAHSTDACLIRGYPGSRMSFLQRMGRAGRSKAGLVVFLPYAQNPFDTYFAGILTNLCKANYSSSQNVAKQ
jgi:ATP-dependent helicase YprA (DUF1998 family)